MPPPLLILPTLLPKLCTALLVANNWLPLTASVLLALT